MKKGEIHEGIVEKVSFPNKGRVRTDEGDVIVKNTMPGQKVRFQVNKKRKNRVEGRLLEVLERSPLETRDPVCGQFPHCGGCTYQTMSYENQLEMKKQEIRELLGDKVDFDQVFEKIYPSPSEFAYRNKMEFSFGDDRKDGPLTLGLHRKNSTYDILTTADCKIVHEDFNLILRSVLEYFSEKNIPYYHKITHTGYLRHLLVRRAAATGEILIDLVTSGQPAGEEYTAGDQLLLQGLVFRLLQLKLEGKIVGILHTINDSVADVIKNEHTDLLFGRGYFFEYILGLKFKITPFSFFQTNSKGAETLYSAAREFLGDVKGKVVFDLYSGTGTIAQILAPVAKKVIGVEIVEEAVEAAKENARENGLDNCEFIAGDVLKVIGEIGEKPDAIVLDPPREGIHPKALPKIIDFGVEHIVYISCKPSSLAEDLDTLIAGGYKVKRMACIDLFPQTQHVETVVLLSKNT